jgi:superfamily II DNA or RNA helicase
VSVGHSIHIRDEFLKSGVRAEHIDGSTPKAERDAALERLASGVFHGRFSPQLGKKALKIIRLR